MCPYYAHATRSKQMSSLLGILPLQIKELMHFQRTLLIMSSADYNSHWILVVPFLTASWLLTNKVLLDVYNVHLNCQYFSLSYLHQVPGKFFHYFNFSFFTSLFLYSITHQFSKICLVCLKYMCNSFCCLIEHKHISIS